MRLAARFVLGGVLSACGSSDAGSGLATTAVVRTAVAIRTPMPTARTRPQRRSARDKITSAYCSRAARSIAAATASSASASSPPTSCASPPRWPASTATAMAAAKGSRCVIVEDGVRCWGDGTYGQLGNGPGTPTPRDRRGSRRSVPASPRSPSAARSRARSPRAARGGGAPADRRAAASRRRARPSRRPRACADSSAYFTYFLISGPKVSSTALAAASSPRLVATTRMRCLAGAIHTVA